jgi:hypothetical protein
MLPGFRFLFTAIVLSMSILVFGLGAAALLRAAHEEFANNPSWRAAPETMFAQQSDATRPMLAMLRLEPRPAEPNASDNVPVAAKPEAVVPPPEQPEQIAALKPAEAFPPESAKPEIQAPENPAQSEAAPAQTGAIAFAETGGASTEPLSPAAQTLSSATEAAPAAAEQAAAPAAPQADAAATKIANLDAPAVAVETPPAKIDGTKLDQSSIEKRLQARRAAHRRRLAARARQVRLAQQQQQQLPLNPFGQPFTEPPVAAHR